MFYRLRIWKGKGVSYIGRYKVLVFKGNQVKAESTHYSPFVCVAVQDYTAYDFLDTTEYKNHIGPFLTLLHFLLNLRIPFKNGSL